MKHFLVAAILCLVFTLGAFAQETDQTPASRADVETYFETVHSHESTKKMLDGVVKSMSNLIHDQYLKDKGKLPENYEETMTQRLESMFKNMPMDEMMQSTIPVYQKHFTKGDINALLAFYSSPTGQKMLQELPTITTESMEAMRPIMGRYIEEMQTKLQEDTQQMISDTAKKAAAAPKN